jgi:hypothetical protein
MTVSMVRGDWGFDIKFQIFQSNGKTPADITGATVKFKMMREGQSENKIDGACTITDGPNGRCKYTVMESDLDTVGIYTTELEVTFADKVLTVRLETIEVVGDLPE